MPTPSRAGLAIFVTLALSGVNVGLHSVPVGVGFGWGGALLVAAVAVGSGLGALAAGGGRAWCWPWCLVLPACLVAIVAALEGRPELTPMNHQLISMAIDWTWAAVWLGVPLRHGVGSAPGAA